MGSAESNSQKRDPKVDAIHRALITLEAVDNGDDYEHFMNDLVPEGVKEMDSSDGDNDAGCMDRKIEEIKGDDNCGEGMSNTRKNGSKRQHLPKNGDPDSIALDPSLVFGTDKSDPQKYTKFLELKFHTDKAGTSFLEALRRKEKLEFVLQSAQNKIVEATSELKELRAIYDDLAKPYLNATYELGLTVDLCGEYQNFCDDLERRTTPSKGDLSRTCLCRCATSHGGSYVKYDDQFGLLKNNINSWAEENFRCEALIEREAIAGDPPLGHGVRFHTFNYSDPSIKKATTWEKLYPGLYKHAYLAACLGSPGARVMLAVLPDHNAPCKGGWVFEYICSHIPSTLPNILACTPASTRTSLDPQN
ncbi:hypothetical protein F5B22DRAFT_658983 [Xylaria bambusicola]|uniref:uncharacterized protein n=1 Tax=Xylaria bambusicola TaxID=326684 RepID=UPI002008D370|nr:uncharacterized protein F5B22DRAFT_658983 [Xylaria bambusicola]KAI0508681.1 hypothetical protein F5B22DRAFT_658983 [Xylaria bambusicola]